MMETTLLLSLQWSSPFKKLIQGLCRIGKTSKAGRVLEMIEESGEAVLPTVVTYTVMIGGYCNQGNVDKALELLDRMMVAPNELTYSTLLKGFCDSGELLDRMKVPPDVVSYATLLKGLCDSGKLDRAMDLLGRLLKTGCYLDVYTYNSLLEAFCEERGIEKALEFLDALRRGCNPNIVTYSILVDGFCKEGRLDDAIKFKNEMSSTYVCLPDMITYCTIIQSLCSSREWMDAKKLFADMIRKGCSPDVVTLNQLIDSWSKKGIASEGLIEEAQKLLSEPGA